MNVITGGGSAPTSSSGATSMWEDDRRRTVFEDRKKKFGIRERGDGRSNGPEKISNPLQEFLNSDGTQRSVDGKKQNGGETKTIDPQQNNIEAWEEQTQQMQRQDNVDDEYDSSDIEENEDDVDYQDVFLDESATGTTTATATANIVGSSSGATTTVKSNTNEIPQIDPATFFMNPNSASLSSPSFSSSTSSKSPSSASSKASLSFDFDEPSSRKVGKVIQSIIPSLRVPRFKIPSLRFRKKSSFDDSAGWSDDEEYTKRKKKIQKPSSFPSSASSLSSSKSSTITTLTSPILDLVERNQRYSSIASKNSFNLLNSFDMKQISKIGKGKAMLDLITLGFAILVVQEVMNVISSSSSSTLSSFTSTLNLDTLFSFNNWNDCKQWLTTFLRNITSINSNELLLLDSWAPYAFISIILTQFTSFVMSHYKLIKQSKALSKMIESNVRGSQLYLQLVSGLKTKHNLPQSISSAALKQVQGAVEIARLRHFVWMSFTIILATTVAVIRPIMALLLSNLVQISSLSTLREWPIDWEYLGRELKDLMLPLGNDLLYLLRGEFNKVIENPMIIASAASLCLALFMIAQIPLIERSRASKAAFKEGGIKNLIDQTETKKARFDEAIRNIGISSAGRLFLQSDNDAIDDLISKWKSRESRLLSMKPKKDSSASSNNLFLQRSGYLSLLGFMTLAPPVLHCVISMLGTEGRQFDWKYFSSMILLLIFTNRIAKTAILTSLEAAVDAPTVAAFLKQLVSTKNEVETTLICNPHQDLHLTATASPLKGIAVTDLWSAHVTKRAWACRGANISCKNGEVVIILGDDSSGKTRLLTSISEAIVTPPKKSRSTTLARGKITIGGVETTKWEKSQLKRRIGILLSDARSLTDISQLYSGSALSEVLQPICPDIPKQLRDSTFANAVGMASQLSGISTTILPSLPSKLSTVITVNEDELSKQTECKPMSASEWSKIILTKVLAQSILCNDNPMSSPNSIAGCLVGSVLLLDDATMYMDEEEEAQFIQNLRASGAATLLTSNRWAVGRFADKIVIIKNGSVVETGTHVNLLEKGGIYAKRFHEIFK